MTMKQNVSFQQGIYPDIVFQFDQIQIGLLAVIIDYNMRTIFKMCGFR